ncbi:MAG: response regulator transcription factor [Chloroflexi bacterium]|nr:response regulator transcription factor [Chloroflexota bacterium]
MTKIKVLIVDDHALMREGIRTLLDLVADFDVVGEASNGKEAIEKVRELRPDVVLMDLAMPVMTGQEAMRRIRKEFPQVKTLVLTQHESSEYVIPAIRLGAHGFVTKTGGSPEIVSAIRAVYGGQSFLSSTAQTALTQEYQSETSDRGAIDPYELLTDREKEVLKLIVEGKTVREIAATMVVTPRAVDAYKARLMKKLNVHNKVDLVKFAIRKQITAP